MENFEETKQEENLPLQSSSKGKYVLIAGIIAVIVGAGILVLLAQKESLPQTPEVISPDVITQDETANWQTYRNAEFGFEMEYPEDWIVNVDTLASRLDEISRIDEIRSSKTESFITISEMDPENLSFDEWIGLVSLLADPPLPRPVGEYATFINGVRAYRFDSYPSDRPFAEISETFIESPTNRIFNLNATSAVKEDREVVNQILSTFRFIE